MMDTTIFIPPVHTKGLTWGGMDSSKALTWTVEAKQQFGGIIYRLYCHDSKMRYEGYTRFYDLRRYFVPEVWNEGLKEIEDYRAGCGVQSLHNMLTEIREQLTKNGYPLPANHKQKGLRL